MNELGNTPADKNYKPSGISKAEERALEAYPEKWTWGFGGRASFKYDQNGLSREACKRGYEQAEKDLALTWEDASVIVTIAMDIIGEGEIHGEQNIYTEVLKRFKEAKK